MNNLITCTCNHCDNDFYAHVIDLLKEDQETIIGDVIWCGVCDGREYDCCWGMFQAGDSRERIQDILSRWTKWTQGYQKQIRGASI